MCKKEEVNYCVACIAEEAGEIIIEAGEIVKTAGKIVKVTGKMRRFGLFDIKPGKELTNFEALNLEIHDLLGAYKLLCEEINTEFFINPILIQNKIDKIKRIKIEFEESNNI